MNNPEQKFIMDEEGEKEGNSIASRDENEQEAKDLAKGAPNNDLWDFPEKCLEWMDLDQKEVGRSPIEVRQSKQRRCGYTGTPPCKTSLHGDRGGDILGIIHSNRDSRPIPAVLEVEVSSLRVRNPRNAASGEPALLPNGVYERSRNIDWKELLESFKESLRAKR